MKINFIFVVVFLFFNSCMVKSAAINDENDSSEIEKFITDIDEEKDHNLQM
jgi:hypothetical protein